MTNEVEFEFLKTIQEDCKTIVHHGNNRTLVCKMNRKSFILFGENCEKLREFETSFRCEDFASTKPGEIVATDFKNKRVMMIDYSNDETMEKVLCSTYPWEPCGICINDREEIVVGAGIEPARLLVLSADGKTILQEVNKDEKGECLFKSYITQIKQNNNGDYVVADDTRLVCLDKNWCVTWEWNVEHMCATCICAVCCDTNSNIYVGDRGRCEIVVLNSECKRLRVLTSNEKLRIYNQMALSIDMNGEFWIGQSLDMTIIKIHSQMKKA